MNLFRMVILVVFGLFVGFSTAQWGIAGDPESATGQISEKQIQSYMEVNKRITENPEISGDALDALLKEQGLSRQEFDSIGQQVATDSVLKKRVEESLTKETQKEIQEFPEVKTKLKGSEAELPEE